MASATAVAPPPPRRRRARARRARPAASELGDAGPGASSDFRGDLAITVDARGLGARRRTLLRDHPELDFKLFLDLCGVDYLDARPRRALRGRAARLLGHARSTTSASRRALPESRRRRCDTLTGVYKGANWFEREAWDLYGIVFKGHPNLTRILTHDAFVGTRMRKDYPTGAAPRPEVAEGVAARRCPPDTEHLVVNIGPSHPAMHGTFRVQALMDGETIADCRGRDRLHAPELREDGGDPDLLADHPVHRPPQLLLVVHERARLGAGGGEAAGHARRRRGPRPSA